MESGYTQRTHTKGKDKMRYNDYRRKSRKIKIGSLCIGGDAPIAVQSMTNTPSGDYDATLNQMRELEKAGCDIVRMAVPDMEAVSVLSRLKESGIGIPIVADIHFNYRLAVESVYAGADKIRINPGNIGGDERIRAVVDACSKKDIPIRVGVNSGSLAKDILAKYGSPTPEALAESAMNNVRLLERFDFDNIVVAIKSSCVQYMVRANEIIADKCDYPIHLGVTEAGTAHMGLIKSCAGIGGMLCRGIGDTIRISLTASPVQEIKEGKALLKALGISEKPSVQVISCPTCGRTKIDIIGLAKELEDRLEDFEAVDSPITVAVMGCAVNGPGEAREADIGIAGGNGEALLFKRGEIIRKVPENAVIDTLIEEIKSMR